MMISYSVKTSEIRVLQKLKNLSIFVLFKVKLVYKTVEYRIRLKKASLKKVYFYNVLQNFMRIIYQ